MLTVENFLNQAEGKLSEWGATVLTIFERGSTSDLNGSNLILKINTLSEIVDAVTYDVTLSADLMAWAYSEYELDSVPLSPFLVVENIISETGSGAAIWSSIVGKPAYFASRMDMVVGLEPELESLSNRITVLEDTQIPEADLIYNFPAPTNVPWAIAAGTNLDGLHIFDIITLATQATLSPQITAFSVSSQSREFTSETTQTTTVSWTVKRRTDAITSIVITDHAGTTYTQSIDATANSNPNGTWSGTQVVPLTENVTNTISFEVETGGSVANVATTSTTVTYNQNRFWFESTTDVLALNDAAITTALNALGSGNKEFAANRNMPVRAFTGTPGAPKYVATAYKASYGNATFIVNAAANNAWTSKTFNYTNASGYTESYLLWQFNDQITGTINVDQN